ncbi:MAG: hypothetical protein HY313_05890 [Acidobacteria bacterium]|nr:hypothetical protein [Acidobacteriota bacterium]
MNVPGTNQRIKATTACNADTLLEEAGFVVALQKAGHLQSFATAKHPT